eukprot:12898841-Prorocentrum_lima.AAC.1
MPPRATLTECPHGALRPGGLNPNSAPRLFSHGKMPPLDRFSHGVSSATRRSRRVSWHDTVAT